MYLDTYVNLCIYVHLSSLLLRLFENPSTIDNEFMYICSFVIATIETF